MSEPSKDALPCHRDLGDRLDEILDIVRSSQTDLNSSVAVLSNRVHELEKRVDQLSGILRDGSGGGEALMTRFAVLCREVRELREATDRGRASGARFSAEEARGRWRVLVALITAIAALAVGLIQVIAR